MQEMNRYVVTNSKHNLYFFIFQFNFNTTSYRIKRIIKNITDVFSLIQVFFFHINDMHVSSFINCLSRYINLKI